MQWVCPPLKCTGPSGDVRDLHPSVTAALYRLAQESITNARRHAKKATQIRVEVIANETGIESPLAVVMITTFDHDEYVYSALKAGARGFLLKDAGPELLAQAIRAAAKGDALIAPSITARLLKSFAGIQKAAPIQPSEPLTEREEEVLLTVARGRTNSEIAQGLHISLSTAKAHIASLMNKLDARNRVEIAIWAYETGRMRT